MAPLILSDTLELSADLTQLGDAAFDREPLGGGPLVRLLLTRPGQARHLSVIANDGGRLAGWIIGSHSGTTGFIDAFAVGPSHRRRGVATALLAELESRLRPSVLTSSRWVAPTGSRPGPAWTPAMQRRTPCWRLAATASWTGSAIWTSPSTAISVCRPSPSRVRSARSRPGERPQPTRRRWPSSRLGISPTRPGSTKCSSPSPTTRRECTWARCRTVGSSALRAMAPIDRIGSGRWAPWETFAAVVSGRPC